MSKKINDLQEKIHEALAEALLDKIKSGEVSASELSVARQYLKDNGVTAVPADGTPLQVLTENLPFDEDDDEGSNVVNFKK